MHHNHDFVHHHDGHHCPHCSCKGNISKVEHPVIFDKRIKVDEQFLHDGFCDSFGHCNCDHCSQCSDQFSIRLAGLNNGMAFKLRQLMDCDTKITINNEGKSKCISARICSVGSDYVEVKVLRKKRRKKKVNNRFRARRTKCIKRKDEFCIYPFDSITSVSLIEERGC